MTPSYHRLSGWKWLFYNLSFRNEALYTVFPENCLERHLNVPYWISHGICNWQWCADMHLFHVRWWPMCDVLCNVTYSLHVGLCTGVKNPLHTRTHIMDHFILEWKSTLDLVESTAKRVMYMGRISLFQESYLDYSVFRSGNSHSRVDFTLERVIQCTGEEIHSLRSHLVSLCFGV